MSPIGPTLTSIHNPHVKFARSLAARKMRSRERAFVVDGVRLFLDAIHAGFRPMRVFVDPERNIEGLRQVLDELAADDTVVHEVTPSVIDAISDTESPQGIAAIFSFPEIPLTLGGEAPLFLIADGVKDPGNLGTLLRTAAAAGAHACFFTPGTVDPYAPKVIRSAMGAHFRLPIRPLDWNAPDPAILGCTQRMGAEAGQGTFYDEIDWRLPSLLLLGSEATGISDQAVEALTGHVSIPMKSQIESLNVAVAGAVILFEAARQRQRQ